MAPSLSHDLRVLLTLQTGDDALTDRLVFFKSSGGSVQIGRASKTERKQLIPARDNMWISNPVISRDHAKLSIEQDDAQSDVMNQSSTNSGYANGLKTLRVFLEDTGSSHGTFVNDNDIKEQGKTRLNTGDLIQFGDRVVRGPDEFDPPVYKVTIEKTIETQPQWSSPGRSISVPEESESEMDESDSEAGSTASRSSPPRWGEEQATKANTLVGSMSNPFTIEDEPEQTPVVIDIASREASEEYEPSPDVPVVPETYPHMDIEVEEQEIEEDEEEEEDDVYNEPDLELSNGPVEAANSPVYIPTSPAYEEFVPQHHVQLPSMEDISHLPLMQPTGCSFNSYRDGPFAQTMEVYDMTYNLSEETQPPEQFSYMPQLISQQPPPARNHPSVTVTTQDLLQTAREPTGKNDMSINSIINPTTTTSRKRKADEISASEFSSGCSQQFVSPSLAGNEHTSIGAVATEGASREKKDNVLIEVVKVTESSTPTAPETRPAKRSRTGITSHLVAFAAGGVAVLTGLMALPNSYFD